MLENTTKWDDAPRKAIKACRILGELPPKPHPGMSPTEAESVLQIGSAVKALFYGRWYEASILNFHGERLQEVEVLWSQENSVTRLPKAK